MQGNLPFLVGEKTFSTGQKIQLLRHAVPTIENGSVSIAEEYKAFVKDCQKQSKKILYCSLLDPIKGDERKRIHALQTMAGDYQNTFFFLRLPLDGPLSKPNDYCIDLPSYKQTILQEIHKGTKGEFLVSDNLLPHVQAHAEETLDLAEKLVSSLVDHETKYRAFYLLFCTLFKDRVLNACGITFYNHTCKDAIDRGAVFLGADLLFTSFISGTLSSELDDLRALIAWPAFMAKTQPILHDRAEWLLAFCSWIDGVRAKQAELRNQLPLTAAISLAR
ncbi:MAG: hypothetical protein FJZ58_00330 [Chlamydiae bacterium]|nr:hypothetical protein [Chlamydiota bacterium]